MTYILPDVDFILPNNSNFFTFMFYLGPLFVMFGSMSLFLSWFSVLETLRTYFPNLFTKQEEKLSKILKIIVFSTSLLTLIALSFKLIIIAALITSLLVIIALFMYITMAFKFINKISSFVSNEDKALERSVALVKKSCYVLLTCLALSVLFGLIYITFSQEHTDNEIIKIGDFNYILFLRDITTWLGLVINTYSAWYVDKITKRMVTRIESTAKLINTNTNTN